jgi:hypothetical protein
MWRMKIGNLASAVSSGLKRPADVEAAAWQP